MNETERKALLKEKAKESRTNALEWTKDKTDAALLDMIVEQRTIIEDIKRETEEELQVHDLWDKALTDELLRRMAETGVKSFRIEGIGIATVTPRRAFSINDPEALYQHVKNTGSIALFGSSLKKAEVEAYEKDHGSLPEGITSHTDNSIRITRSK